MISSDIFISKAVQSFYIYPLHFRWCGPCKTLGPRLESLVSSKKGKVILAKVNVDEVSSVAMEYEVCSLDFPTVLHA